jgi:hypothetical protein
LPNHSGGEKLWACLRLEFNFGDLQAREFLAVDINLDFLAAPFKGMPDLIESTTTSGRLEFPELLFRRLNLNFISLQALAGLNRLKEFSVLSSQPHFQTFVRNCYVTLPDLHSRGTRQIRSVINQPFAFYLFLTHHPSSLSKICRLSDS